MKFNIAIFFALVAAGLSCLTSCASSSIPKEMTLLQASISGFAVMHGGRFPNSWDEMCKYEGRMEDYYLSYLRSLGRLRWSWEIENIPPDGMYIYIYNPKYKKHQDELNRHFMQSSAWAVGKKFHDWGDYNPYRPPVQADESAK